MEDLGSLIVIQFYLITFHSVTPVNNNLKLSIDNLQTLFQLSKQFNIVKPNYGFN